MSSMAICLLTLKPQTFYSRMKNSKTFLASPNYSPSTAEVSLLTTSRHMYVPKPSPNYSHRQPLETFALGAKAADLNLADESETPEFMFTITGRGVQSA